MTTAAPARTPLDAGTPTRVWLVAVLTAMCLEMVRASGPLLDRAFTAGTVDAALAALVTYGGAGLVVALVLVVVGRRSGSPDARTLLVGSVLLAVLRLVIQGLDGLALDIVGLVTVAVAVGVLTLAVAFVTGRPAGGRQAAVGLMLGCGLSIGLQLVLGTWDAMWRSGWAGWTVAVLLAVSAAGTARALAALTTPDTEPTGRPRRLWALGPFLAIAAMIVANPAFAASQSGVGLAAVGVVLVVANAVGTSLLLRPAPWSAPVRVSAAVLLVVGVGAALWLPDVGALVAVVILELSLGIVLSAALSAHRPAPPGIPRAAAATLVVGLLTIGPLLLYMLDYDVPLGVDNAWVLVITAGALALSGLRHRTPQAGAVAITSPDHLPRSMSSVRPLLTPAIVLGLAGLVVSTLPSVPARAADDTLTLVDWNLHYGVSPLTAVELESIAETIEDQHADVVTLQEVERGWIFGGGADMATWLSHRLGMTIAFAPAADRQFGNAVLARSALTDVAVHPLPYGAGPQQRSALATTLTTASGQALRVTSVHLQHRASNTATRLDQLQALADAEPVTPPAILAGDLNATPGSPEIELLTGAGWVSAVDAAGDPGALTSSSTDLTERIDWVFGQGVTFESAEVLDGLTQSDHLPVVARFSAGG